MIDLEQMHREAEALERYVRLQTYPLAIKLLRKESDIPPEFSRGYYELLHESDMVKFARWKPEMTVAESFISRCRELITRTRPEPSPEEAEHAVC